MVLILILIFILIIGCQRANLDNKTIKINGHQITILGDDFNNNTIEEIIDENNITKCIGEKSKLYISTGCPHCRHQMNVFGENIKYINIINCIENPRKCVENDIYAVPTWIINGEKYLGYHDLDDLASIAGCR